MTDWHSKQIIITTLPVSEKKHPFVEFYDPTVAQKGVITAKSNIFQHLKLYTESLKGAEWHPKGRLETKQPKGVS